MRLGILCLCCVFLVPTPLFAYGTYQGEKVPPLTRDEGRVNLHHEWTVHHGARLYWRSVQIPSQVRLAGRDFKDPADLPVLDMKNTCDDCYKKRSYTKKRRVKKRRATRSSVKKVAAVTPKSSAQSIPALKPHPQRALGPVKRRARGRRSVGSLPMRPVDPVGNPLQ